MMAVSFWSPNWFDEEEQGILVLADIVLRFEVLLVFLWELGVVFIWQWLHVFSFFSDSSLLVCFVVVVIVVRHHPQQFLQVGLTLLFPLFMPACWTALSGGPITAPFPIPYLFEQEDE